MYLFVTNHSFAVCRANKLRRTFNQLSLRFTLCSAKDETQTAGKGTPLTLLSALTSKGGVA